ncbi:MAG: SRPBCC family protein [Candidatus Sericytochromatia bacterium]|nr:SRPBCC family protein [Candidatus Tanganyikabacteria bacterium]
MLRSVLPLAALLVAIAAPPAWAGARVDLSAGQLRRIERNEILTRIEETPEPVKTVTSIGLVRHPARDVYLLMTDFKNYARIYNSIEKAEVEPGGGRVILSHYKVGVPWPLEARTVTTRTWVDPDRHAFRWERVKGTLREYAGELLAVPVSDGRCIVFYSAKVDPGYDWLPSWFVTWGQTYVLPSIVRAIRDTLGKRVGPYWEAGVVRPAFSQEPPDRAAGN